MIRVNRAGEVWVFAEQEDGVLNDVSLELCGKVRQLGDQLGVKVAAVLPGCDVRPLSRRLIAHGVDRVYSVHDEKLRHYQTNAYAKVLVELVEEARAADRAVRRHAPGRDWRRAWPRRCGPG